MKKTTSIIITLLRTLADELEGAEQAAPVETAALAPAGPPVPAPVLKKRGRPAAQPQVDVPTNVHAPVEQQPKGSPPVETTVTEGKPHPGEGENKVLTYEDLRALCMPMIKNPPHNEIVKTTIREFIPDDGGLKKLAEHPEFHSAFEAKIMAYRNENNLH